MGELSSNTTTFVVLDNDYPATSWACRLQSRLAGRVLPGRRSPPGSSSAPQDTVPASANTAYVVLAPAAGTRRAGAPPTSFVVLQSKQGFGVDLSDYPRYPVSDATFAGNCAAGSFLTQSQADFITQLVFPDVFGGFHVRRRDLHHHPAR